VRLRVRDAPSRHRNDNRHFFDKGIPVICFIKKVKLTWNGKEIFYTVITRYISSS